MSATEAYELVYDGGSPDEDLAFDIEQLDSERRAEENTGFGKHRRPSVYVEAFEKMVNTVCESEPHLLTAKELDVLAAFAGLPYDARYCLVRLLLRKTSAWHTLKSMEKFKKEIGEDGLTCAIVALCKPIKAEPDIKKEIKEEPELNKMPGVEIIDLTFDSDEEETKPIITVTDPGPSSTKEREIEPSFASLLQFRDEPPYEPNFSFFLEDETSMGLEEVLKKLSNDQLRELVKETKIKPEKMNKDAIIYSLFLYASTQQPLGFDLKGSNRRNMQSRDGLKQTLLTFNGRTKAKPETQEKRLLQMALAKLGRSVRVNVDLYWLVARLNVIYERSTEYPKSLLVPSLLISFKKRSYPEYAFTRDSMIWPSREELMDYFEALRLESAIQTELEPPSPGRPSTKTPAPTIVHQNKFVTPVPPSRGRTLTTPLWTPLSATRFTESPVPGKDEEDNQEDEAVPEPEEPLKIQTARRIKKVFDEHVFPKWKELVAKRQGQGAKARSPGLERFEPGFVYTRIFGHAMQALAALKLHAEENAVLEALLQQNFWRQGRRARWYERRALLHTNYLCWSPNPEEKKKDLYVLRQAMEGIKEALNDEDTHLIYRPSLVRRLMRLEKQLKVAEEHRSFCSGELRKAEEVQFFAERITKSDNSLELDVHGRPIKGKENGLRIYFSPKVTNGKTSADAENPASAEKPTVRKWKGKSLWRGRNGEQINVECRALQYYEDLGYKGFHSETRILTTLFALLFWDIIFTDVPGAFETMHQTAPLDLAHDSFYRARKGLIDTRLQEIQQKGRAWEIVEHHDDLYREKNTWCIGVRWDICPKEDLLDIVECLGGESLAIICRLFCEDYAGRSSGVPDLIVWKTTTKICKFVEVKGPGDSPSENQKLWFDSLIGAGANVEICKVLDKDKPLPKSSAKKAGTLRSSKGKRKIPASSNVEMDFDSLDSHDHLHDKDKSYGSSPGPRKRRRPPDENADLLPTIYSSTIPPSSPSAASILRCPNQAEVMIPPLKKQKLEQSPQPNGMISAC
ncbi:hypothetical protein H2248_009100 [Termitomyces sp. 'cryptogamus']|nr:hypothetical protein H2248_009100 [Termitomyces sp. 'cryptogamus']